jgi:tRNA (mo5U34)-methyltransferase
MTPDELRAKVDALRWYHTIDLGHGVVTKGVDDTPLRLARVDLPASLAGRSVLDIGAWDGFFSFEAERRGASRVEDVDIDVLDLRPERVGGTFDVVFFLGVLYHLPNPLLALERVASVASDLLILETVVDMVGVRRPTAAFYPGRELNDDPTNWWGPNEAAVHGMLRAVGFEDVRTVTPLPSAPYRAARAVSHWMRGKNTLRGAFRQDRAVFHARRSGRQA